MSNKKPTAHQIAAVQERYMRWSNSVIVLGETCKRLVATGRVIDVADMLLEIEQKTGKKINDVTMEEVNKALGFGWVL